MQAALRPDLPGLLANADVSQAAFARLAGGPPSQQLVPRPGHNPTLGDGPGRRPAAVLA